MERPFPINMIIPTAFRNLFVHHLLSQNLLPVFNLTARWGEEFNSPIQQSYRVFFVCLRENLRNI